MNEKNAQPTTVDQQIYIELNKMTQVLVTISRTLGELNVAVQAALKKIH
jgi:hypothetical protein